MRGSSSVALAVVMTGALAVHAGSALAQPPAAPPAPAAQGGGRGSQPVVVSPEVAPDRKITFRILAPQAQAVRLAAGDIPGVGQATALTKADNGVWSITVGPVVPGAYRYNFNVDGVATIDPRSPATSESNNNTWSLVVVSGSDTMDVREVPHGAVASITYHSKALDRVRRMHVYTPPGYQNNTTKYPVFYLLHGAGDSDDSWTSVGRANFILDNLIASGKAKPMIVVMTAGHTNPPGPTAPGVGSMTDEFVKDFVGDVMPYIDRNYRVTTGAANRAIAGLSMGGFQTLYVAIPRLDQFSYVGVFSSGLIGAFPMAGRGGAGRAGGPAMPQGPSFEEQYKAALDNPAFKKNLKLLWFGTGKEDFLLDTTKGTIEILKKHGFEPIFHESEGGHTWLNWRDYLVDFAPKLFR